jgi:hypothetical protein
VPAYLLALGTGIVLASVKAVYSLLPLFNVLDVIVFGGVGVLFGRWRRGAWWLRCVFLGVPAVALSLLFCARLGPSQLKLGVGVGWAVSAILVPVAVLAGAYVGFRSTREVRGLSQTEEGSE